MVKNVLMFTSTYLKKSILQLYLLYTVILNWIPYPCELRCGFEFPIINSRVEIPVSPASTPNLLMQSPIIDPITKRSVLDDMYQEIKWLIDDQHITHLRRKIPVTLDVLKQVN